MTDPKAIAAGLTPTLRNGVRAFPTGISAGNEIGIGHGFDMFMLIYRGLITFRKKWWFFGEPIFYLTPLGIAVRDEIMKGDE